MYSKNDYDSKREETNNWQKNDLANVDFDIDFSDIGNGYDEKILNEIDEKKLTHFGNAQIQGNIGQDETEIKINDDDLENELIDEMIYNMTQGKSNDFNADQTIRIVEEISCIKFIGEKSISKDLIQDNVNDYFNINGIPSCSNRDIKMIVKQIENLSLK